MKILVFLIFMACAATTVRAQKSPFYYFEKERIALKTVYDKDGNEIGNQEYSVLSVDGTRVQGQNIITKPGKKDETTSCHYMWEDGKLLIAMGANKDGKEVFLDYYTGMKPGSAVIEGIEFGTQAKLAGMKVKLTCTISERAVTATGETISSNDQQWECVKTEYDMELRSNFFGIPVNVHVVEWFAPGVGIVRTDVYRRGKLYEKRLLTGFRTAAPDALATNMQ